MLNLVKLSGMVILVQDDYGDQLLWYKNNENKFPLHARLANRTLNNPVTAASCE